MSTPAPPGPTPITPRLDGEAIVLTFGDTSPFGAAELETAGEGVLTFDPAAPDRLIGIRVAQPEDAEATLTTAIGAAATQQLISMWASGDITGEVVPEPSAALAPLGRLALVSWLEQWTPLDIPGQALVLDVGAQAHAAGHPLLAVRAFASSAEYLVAIAERGTGASLPRPIAQGITDALTAAADTLKQGHPLSSRIAELAREWTSRADHEEADWSALLQDLLDAESVLIAGVDPDLGVLFSVDWALVPSRVLHPEEGQGHLTMTDSGLRITVVPARWLDAAATMSLRARLVDPDSGVTLADAPLLWDANAQAFAADLAFADWPDVAPKAMGDAQAEVYAEALDGSRPVPRIKEARDSARAWREAVRALTRHRRSQACDLALGQRLVLEDRMAAMLAQSAAADLDAIGHPASASALRAWKLALEGDHASGPWPTGVVGPASVGVARPTLAEMMEVAAPELFDVVDQ